MAADEPSASPTGLGIDSEAMKSRGSSRFLPARPTSIGLVSASATILLLVLLFCVLLVASGVDLAQATRIVCVLVV